MRTAAPGEGRRHVEVTTTDEQILRQCTNRLADPHFRAWQAGWRRRIAASRRLAPLFDGTCDPLAPGGRWGR